MHKHIFRHTAITEFWKLTGDPKATMDFARFDSYTTILRYIKSTDYDKQNEIIKDMSWNQF
jgi:hypothetical protein